MTEVSLERQLDAWKRYTTARQHADETLDFADGRAAAEAWIGFLNSYLSEDEQMPERRLGPNVSIFPVHRARLPSHVHAREEGPAPK